MDFAIEKASIIEFIQNKQLKLFSTYSIIQTLKLLVDNQRLTFIAVNSI